MEILRCMRTLTICLSCLTAVFTPFWIVFVRRRGVIRRNTRLVTASSARRKSGGRRKWVQNHLFFSTPACLYLSPIWSHITICYRPLKSHHPPLLLNRYFAGFHFNSLYIYIYIYIYEISNVNYFFVANVRTAESASRGVD